MSNIGKLIVFEGIDGVGKTTISKLVTQKLSELGNECLCMSFPGRREGTLGAWVYDFHHRMENHLDPISAASLQTLHVAAHLDSIERTILPALRAGIFVVLDRYWWSTWAYGLSSGVNETLLTCLIQAEKIAWEGVVPYKLFYLIRNNITDANKQIIKSQYSTLVGREQSSYSIIEVANDHSIEDALAHVMINLH